MHYTWVISTCAAAVSALLTLSLFPKGGGLLAIVIWAGVYAVMDTLLDATPRTRKQGARPDGAPPGRFRSGPARFGRRRPQFAEWRGGASNTTGAWIARPAAAPRRPLLLPLAERVQDRFLLDPSRWRERARPTAVGGDERGGARLLVEVEPVCVGGLVGYRAARPAQPLSPFADHRSAQVPVGGRAGRARVSLERALAIAPIGGAIDGRHRPARGPAGVPLLRIAPPGRAPRVRAALDGRALALARLLRAYETSKPVIFLDVDRFPEPLRADRSVAELLGRGRLLPIRAHGRLER